MVQPSSLISSGIRISEFGEIYLFKFTDKLQSRFEELIYNQSSKLMPDEALVDPFIAQLCEGYTEAEVAEIKQYLAEWDASTYMSVAQSILDHASRKEFEPLKYLRKAHSFNKKRAVRVPKTGYRQDG